jgi:DNA-binding transcriptional LysR family regulator
MRFQKLDLNLLYALDVLLVEKNITRAAKVLHLSQSATSAILARLREYFEDELLTQVGRTMVPTATALSLQEPVHDLLLRIQTTLGIRPTFTPASCTRRFRLVASDYTASVVLDDLVKRLAREAPEVAVEILHPSIPATEQLLRGEADLMFLPSTYAPAGLPFEKLLDDTFSCVVCKDNAEVGEELTREQFLTMGHVVTRFSGSILTYSDEFLAKAGFALRNEVVIANFSNLAMMVMATRRIGIVHTRLAHKLEKFFPVRVLASPVEIPSIELQMLWHPFLEKDPAHLWLRGLVQDIVRQVPSPAAVAGQIAAASASVT